MADCDCCGCVTRDNYRAHRVVGRKFSASVYEEPFGTRTSAPRDFSQFYDRFGPGSWEWRYGYDHAGDTLGPYSIECSRPWEIVDDFGFPLAQIGGEWRDDGGAMNGESTLVGVYGNQFHLQGFVNRATLATGDATIIIWAASQTATLAYRFYAARPGGASTYRFPFWPYVGPPITGGTLGTYGGYGVETLLEFGGQSRVAWDGGTAADIGLLVSFASGHLGQNTDGGYVTAYAQASSGGDYAGEINRPATFVEQNPDDPNIWPDQTPTAPDPNPRSQPGYFSAPVTFGGRKLSVYRDGALVAQLTNPTEAQALAASAENGSYLLVNEPDADADPPWDGEGRDDRTRYARPFKTFRSFAKDDTPPIVGCSPPQDSYHGIALPADPEPAATYGWVNATKPVVLFDDDPYRLPSYCWSDHDGDRVPRPFITANGFVLESDHSRPLHTLEPGTHEVRHAALVQNPYCAFGNEATSVPTFMVTIHPAPGSDDTTAPYPRLDPPGLHTREYFRARLALEQVDAVELTFLEGRVLPDGINADQLTLTVNGQTVSGCTIAPAGDQRWRITVPTVPQVPKSFCVLTYAPAGNVIADRNRVETWPEFDRFPPANESEWRVAYVDGKTGIWYTKTPSGYQTIAENSPPLKANGQPYVNEPVVCAARVAWLMAAETPWPRPVDVNVPNVVTVGTVSSIGREVETLPEQDGTFRFGCTGNAYIRDWGSVRSAGKVEGYSPNCPADEPESPDCSWFGLSTTIDPCPPKTLACPAPNADQRHSSAIRSTSEITALKISMVRKEPLDFEPPVWTEYTLGTTLYGRTLPQNLYGFQIPAGPVPTSPAAPIPFLNPPAPAYFVEAGVIFAAFFRRLYELPALKTSIPEELRIFIRQQLLVRQTPTFGASTYRTDGFYEIVTLSRADEDALIAGQPVEIPYRPVLSNVAPFRRAFWWRIQRA